MTNRELGSDGVRVGTQPSIRMDLKTLQGAVDKNVEITEGDIALDKAKERLPSLIAVRNKAMLNKAHPLEVYEAPAPKEVEATKTVTPETMMDMMTTE